VPHSWKIFLFGEKKLRAKKKLPSAECVVKLKTLPCAAPSYYFGSSQSALGEHEPFPLTSFLMA